MNASQSLSQNSLYRFLFSVVAVSGLLCHNGAIAFGDISIIAGGSYSQNFDSTNPDGLKDSPVGNFASQVPAGWTFLESGVGADSQYRISSGTHNSGDTYSYGVAGVSPVTDRAFGSQSSSSNLPIIGGATFVNSGAQAIGSLSISLQGEVWRKSSRDALDDRLVFAYSTDATSLNTGTWTTVSSLDVVSIRAASDFGAKDGNLAPQALSGSFTFATPVATGEKIWIRWSDLDLVGVNNDGMAIDDVQVQALAVPEPSSLFGVGIVALGFALKRRRATA